ncbi:MAG TPA: hypothetical protein VGK24_01175 [Candidatus Angelobacter sp.]|jgi:hypothetical protein
MSAFRKIPILDNGSTLYDRPTRKHIIVGIPRGFHNDDPKLILYRAPSEKIIQGPEDILELLRAEGVVQKGITRARNPITHGHYSFIATLAQNHDALITLSIALIPAVIGWLKNRKGRRIEIQKGDLKVSAPNERVLEIALKALAKYEKFTVVVSKARVKIKK